MKENLSQEEIVRKQMYEALKRFFKSDMKIKEAMSKLAPTEMDQENEIEYIDKLYRFIKETESQFMNISQDFKFGTRTIQSLKDFFAKAEESFLSNAYKDGNVQSMFMKQISNMDENLIEEVKENFVGYAPLRAGHLSELINKARTVNELLHVIHSYIINNENILQAMPIIATKRNGVSRDPMVLYGEKTELAQKLFDAIPSDLDCGYTDIISMQDRILMMIRDRGHALTIDIDSADEKGDILVKYFVPKLCNEEMIKRLPGVGNISPNGASGIFICKEDELSKRLFDFIGKFFSRETSANPKSLLFELRLFSKITPNLNEN